MKWILIIFVMGSYGKAVDHVEFNTYDNCEHVQKSIEKLEPGRIYSICVPKDVK